MSHHAILDVNAVAAEVYGYTRDEFLGMTLRDLRAVEDLAAFEQLRPVIEGDGRFTYQTRHKKRDGSLIDVEVTADVVEFEGSRARIGLAVDVTRRESTARALRPAKSRSYRKKSKAPRSRVPTRRSWSPT